MFLTRSLIKKKKNCAPHHPHRHGLWRGMAQVRPTTVEVKGGRRRGKIVRPRDHAGWQWMFYCFVLVYLFFLSVCAWNPAAAVCRRAKERDGRCCGEERKNKRKETKPNRRITEKRRGRRRRIRRRRRRRRKIRGKKKQQIEAVRQNGMRAIQKRTTVLAGTLYRGSTRRRSLTDERRRRRPCAPRPCACVKRGRLYAPPRRWGTFVPPPTVDGSALSSRRQRCRRHRRRRRRPPADGSLLQSVFDRTRSWTLVPSSLVKFLVLDKLLLIRISRRVGPRVSIIVVVFFVFNVTTVRVVFFFFCPLNFPSTPLCATFCRHIARAANNKAGKTNLNFTRPPKTFDPIAPVVRHHSNRRAMSRRRRRWPDDDDPFSRFSPASHPRVMDTKTSTYHHHHHLHQQTKKQTSAAAVIVRSRPVQFAQTLARVLRIGRKEKISKKAANKVRRVEHEDYT